MKEQTKQEEDVRTGDHKSQTRAEMKGTLRTVAQGDPGLQLSPGLEGKQPRSSEKHGRSGQMELSRLQN
jgi:hypothetical protein